MLCPTPTQVSTSGKDVGNGRNAHDGLVVLAALHLREAKQVWKHENDNQLSSPKE